MTVNEVKKQIKAKQLCPYYVFTGAEIEAQRIYINKVAEITGKQIRRIEAVSEAFKKRGSVLRVSNVFICRDDLDFWKNAVDLETLDNLLGDNILILQMSEVDKRTKTAKLHADRIVTFDYMDADVLYKYAQRECRLSDDSTFDLIDICERDYSRIILETDKINRYARAQGVSVDEAFSILLDEGTIRRPPKDAIFDFVDAMLRADISGAFRHLQDCKELGEPSLRIISVLYSNFKRVLQVQACQGRDICEETGLTSWDVKLARQTVGTWQISDLVFFLRKLQEVEQGIKTGEIDEDVSLDYLLAVIL